jgi:hypothetical protein
MKKVNLIAVAFIALGVSGCSTLFGDSQALINVRASNGQAFEGQLSDGTFLKAPGTVAFRKDGSQPVKIITNDKACASVTTVDRQIDGIFWANVISGGLLGSGTDYVSGKMWDYDTNVIIACRD